MVASLSRKNERNPRFFHKNSWSLSISKSFLIFVLFYFFYLDLSLCRSFEGTERLNEVYIYIGTIQKNKNKNKNSNELFSIQSKTNKI